MEIKIDIVGYILGCTLSIIFWKIDRVYILEGINEKLKKKFHKVAILEFFILIIFILIGVAVWFVDYRVKSKDNVILKSFFNGVIAFITIHLSTAEKKNVDYQGKKKFQNSIAVINEGLVYGFIAPIFYILFFKNLGAFVYFIVYIFYKITQGKVEKVVFNILNIIPTFIAMLFLYIVQLFYKHSFYVSFEGKFFENLILNPILNVNIISAYIEGVNFYHFNYDTSTTIQCYGESKKSLDEKCINHYINITYICASIIFLIFLFLKGYIFY